MSGQQATVRKRQNRLSQSGEALTESAKRQVAEVGHVASDAVTSGAWAYPLLGIFYLISHPSLMKPILPSVFKGAVVSVAILAALFFLTYLPQVAVLAFVSGPLAFIAAVPLVLGEAYVVINFFMRTFIFGQVGVDLFDSVLVQKGHSALVERGRQVTDSGGKSKQLGRMLTKPLSRFSTDNIVRYLLTLPLNFIPVVGTAFFLGYNGLKAGPGYHARYFQLKGFDKDKRHSAIQKRRGAYTAFGTVAMVLNLIPIVSILFTFTTSIGAALWAADIESKRNVNPAQEIASGARGQGSDEVDVVVSDAKKDL
ncbi:hypothetical protein DB88DRAFT_493169 [Papiliotrema laurentii]|uniref:Outer spore wall protein RRT8 n=1 Tax=Papiliotrema laurentii TaxID=5418 RepID=A0AAD9CYH2_PAPLA|nr:hypothetical protein DB88DRAFT_493169 [Papiliotrema laurentii]